MQVKKACENGTEAMGISNNGAGAMNQRMIQQRQWSRWYGAIKNGKVGKRANAMEQMKIMLKKMKQVTKEQRHQTGDNSAKNETGCLRAKAMEQVVMLQNNEAGGYRTKATEQVIR